MQTPKEEIKRNILTEAKKEFLKNGFEKASVRSITSNAKTSKSNVYNYFSDKDALFCAVVENTLTGVKKGLENIREENRRKNEAYSITVQKQVILRIIHYVFENKDDFKLLLFSSSGSTLSGFKNDVVEQLAEALIDWVRLAAPEKKIPDLFVRSLAGFYVGAIERILIEEKTKEQVSGHLDVYLKFIYGGWSAILSS